MTGAMVTGGVRGRGRAFDGLLSSLLLIACVAPWACRAAEFTRSFAGIENGTGLLLIWEEIPAEYMPLTVFAQLVNRTGDDYRANVFKRNLTTGVNGTSWLWQNMPSPLPFVSTALYQVEIKSQFGAPAAGNATGKALVFPRSPYFSVLDGTTVKPNTGTSTPAPSGNDSALPGNKTTSMAVGLVVGFVLLAIVCTAIYCWRRRYVRSKKAKKQLGKFDIVIH